MTQIKKAETKLMISGANATSCDAVDGDLVSFFIGVLEPFGYTEDGVRDIIRRCGSDPCHVEATVAEIITQRKGHEHDNWTEVIHRKTKTLQDGAYGHISSRKPYSQNIPHESFRQRRLNTPNRENGSPVLNTPNRENGSPVLKSPYQKEAQMSNAKDDNSPTQNEVKLPSGDLSVESATAPRSAAITRNAENYFSLSPLHESRAGASDTTNHDLSHPTTFQNGRGRRRIEASGEPRRERVGDVGSAFDRSNVTRPQSRRERNYTRSDGQTAYYRKTQNQTGDRDGEFHTRDPTLYRERRGGAARAISDRPLRPRSSLVPHTPTDSQPHYVPPIDQYSREDDHTHSYSRVEFTANAQASNRNYEHRNQDRRRMSPAVLDDKSNLQTTPKAEINKKRVTDILGSLGTTEGNVAHADEARLPSEARPADSLNKRPPKGSARQQMQSANFDETSDVTPGTAFNNRIESSSRYNHRGRGGGGSWSIMGHRGRGAYLTRPRSPSALYGSPPRSEAVWQPRGAYRRGKRDGRSGDVSEGVHQPRKHPISDQSKNIPTTPSTANQTPHYPEVKRERDVENFRGTVVGCEAEASKPPPQPTCEEAAPMASETHSQNMSQLGTRMTAAKPELPASMTDGRAGAVEISSAQERSRHGITLDSVNKIDESKTSATPSEPVVMLMTHPNSKFAPHSLNFGTVGVLTTPVYAPTSSATVNTLQHSSANVFSESASNNVPSVIYNNTRYSSADVTANAPNNSIVANQQEQTAMYDGIQSASLPLECLLSNTQKHRQPSCDTDHATLYVPPTRGVRQNIQKLLPQSDWTHVDSSGLVPASDFESSGRLNTEEGRQHLSQLISRGESLNRSAVPSFYKDLRAPLSDVAPDAHNAVRHPANTRSVNQNNSALFSPPFTAPPTLNTPEPYIPMEFNRGNNVSHKGKTEDALFAIGACIEATGEQGCEENAAPLTRSPVKVQRHQFGQPSVANTVISRTDSIESCRKHVGPYRGSNTGNKANIAPPVLTAANNPTPQSVFHAAQRSPFHVPITSPNKLTPGTPMGPHGGIVFAQNVVGNANTGMAQNYRGHQSSDVRIDRRDMRLTMTNANDTLEYDSKNNSNQCGQTRHDIQRNFSRINMSNIVRVAGSDHRPFSRAPYESLDSRDAAFDAMSHSNQLYQVENDVGNADLSLRGQGPHVPSTKAIQNSPKAQQFEVTGRKETPLTSNVVVARHVQLTPHMETGGRNNNMVQVCQSPGRTYLCYSSSPGYANNDANGAGRSHHSAQYSEFHTDQPNFNRSAHHKQIPSVGVLSLSRPPSAGGISQHQGATMQGASFMYASPPKHQRYSAGHQVTQQYSVDESVPSGQNGCRTTYSPVPYHQTHNNGGHVRPDWSMHRYMAHSSASAGTGQKMEMMSAYPLYPLQSHLSPNTDNVERSFGGHPPLVMTDTPGTRQGSSSIIGPGGVTDKNILRAAYGPYGDSTGSTDNSCINAGQQRMVTSATTLSGWADPTSTNKHHLSLEMAPSFGSEYTRSPEHHTYGAYTPALGSSHHVYSGTGAIYFPHTATVASGGMSSNRDMCRASLTVHQGLSIDGRTQSMGAVNAGKGPETYIGQPATYHIPPGLGSYGGYNAYMPQNSDSFYPYSMQ